MKYLKSFKINESNIPSELMTIGDIEEYFSDLLDSNYKIEELIIVSPFMKVWEGGYSKSPSQKKDHNWYHRYIIFKKLIKSDHIKSSEEMLKYGEVFINCTKRIVSAEDIKILDIQVRKSEENGNDNGIKNYTIEFNISFIEKLIDSEEVSDEITGLYDDILSLLRAKTNNSNIRYGYDDIKKEIKGDSIVLDCSTLSKVQVKNLVQFFIDKFSKIESSRKRNIREIERGQEVFDMFGRPAITTYYKFDIRIVNSNIGPSIIFNNIKAYTK